MNVPNLTIHMFCVLVYLFQGGSGNFVGRCEYSFLLLLRVDVFPIASSITDRSSTKSSQEQVKGRRGQLSWYSRLFILSVIITIDSL